MGLFEKRKSPRIIVDFVSVEIHPHGFAGGDADPREICPVKNISETGMLFESEKPFDPGTILRLTFAVPDSPIVIRTDSIVIHAQKRKVFEIGVQYKDLAIAEQKLLHHFINKALAKAATPPQSA
jgi:hypothetical protein